MAAWEYFTNQKQWESYLKDLVRSDDKALLRAIVCIYDNQTDEEKLKGESIEDNCIGFSKIDAKEMGDIARKIKAGKPLTKSELAKSRNKMQKYWKQLMIISKKQASERSLRRQEEIDRKFDEEASELERENKAKLESFRQHNETLRQCAEEGKSCDYGICDECPIVMGFQMRLNF